MTILNNSGMQENEFEKQLKKMMEDFDLKPSDAVWDKVKRKLNDRNRRMIPFFILLLTGLLVAGYFLYNASTQQNKISNTVINTKNKNKEDKKVTDSLKNVSKIFQQENRSVQTENKLAAKNQAQNNSAIYLLHTHKKEGQFINTNKNIEVKKDNAIPEKKLPLLPNELNPDLQSPAQLHNDKTNDITVNNAPVYQDSSSVKETITNNNNEASKNIIQHDVTESNNNNKNIIRQDSANSKQNIFDTSHKPKPKKSSSNNKIPDWQWGITALYGKSNLIESIVDLNKSYTPSSLNNGDTLGGTNSFINKKLYTASEAYNISGIVQKKIFKNGLVSIGLNYTHLSIKSGTTQQVDSALYFQYANGNSFTVASYYNPGKVSNYKSIYNFIEMPVNFQQDIFRKNKIALSYNAGISVRTLLNSRSLIYDEYSNIYYSNNSLLRKTQFQFLAGLNMNFKMSNSSSIFIGPQFSYSLSNLTKNTNSSNFHFITYGLQAGILLNKK